MSSEDPYLHEYFRRFRTTPNSDGSRRSIVFVVGSTGISGGTYVILQYADFLLDHGWDVSLTAMNIDHGSEPWHPVLARVPCETLEEASSRSYDIACATWWPTVYELPRIRARHHLYLVQSIEARFYGDEPDHRWAQPLAELTYTFGLPIVTIAGWMQVYLALRHRAPSFLVRNGIRKDTYTTFGPRSADREAGKLRVLVEGPVGIAMKNVESAVRLARAGGADEIWLMSALSTDGVTNVDRAFERVNMNLTPLIYRSCDVLVKLSQVEGMYGPPLEMFHCGGTVVTYDVTGHEEYVEHGVNGLVVRMGDEAGVVEAIRSLKRDEMLLEKLKRNALLTAHRWPSWDDAASEFNRFMTAIARQPAVDRTQALLAIIGARGESPL